jgi:hypothetical protein
LKKVTDGSQQTHLHFFGLTTFLTTYVCLCTSPDRDDHCP